LFNFDIVQHTWVSINDQSRIEKLNHHDHYHTGVEKDESGLEGVVVTVANLEQSVEVDPGMLFGLTLDLEGTVFADVQVEHEHLTVGDEADQGVGHLEAGGGNV